MIKSKAVINKTNPPPSLGRARNSLYFSGHITRIITVAIPKLISKAIMKIRH
jgi:hypothetical protein